MVSLFLRPLHVIGEVTNSFGKGDPSWLSQREFEFFVEFCDGNQTDPMDAGSRTGHCRHLGPIVTAMTTVSLEEGSVVGTRDMDVG